MPSTFTDNGGIEKIGLGEQAGTWGTTTNANFDIVDRLINGVGTITLSGTTHTLTTSDGSLSDGMFKVLELAGSPSGTNTITISPNNADKLYFVKNGTSQTATFTQGSGGNVSIVAGKGAIIFADGAGSGAAVTDFTAAVQNVTDLSSPFNVGATSVTTSGAELNLLDGSAAGTIANSKAVIYGSSGEVNATTLQIAGTSITATAAELNYVDGVTSAIQTQIDGKMPLGTVIVTVANPGSGNKYYIDGSLQQTLEIKPSVTYRFDQSDSSNNGHPLRFSTTSNGTHAGGSEFTTGVTTAGTPGSAGAYTQVKLEQDAPSVLYYYCTNHSGMGGKAVVRGVGDLTASRALTSNSNGDVAVSGVTTTELNILDGLTASTAELNIMDGVTASTAELNILDGVTATTAELNYVDGVTSAIQTQIDSKINGSALNASNLSSGTVPDARLPSSISSDITGNAATATTAAALTGDVTKTGDFTVDATGDIILDADGGDFILKDNGTTRGKISVVNTVNLPDKVDFYAGSGTALTDLEMRINTTGVNISGGLRVGDLSTTPSGTGITAQGDITSAADVVAVSNVSAGGELKLTGGAQDWTFEVDGSNRLVIQYNGTSLARIDTSGNLVVAGDVTSFGSL